MVNITELEDVQEANVSKGKLPRQYINTNNKSGFYISQGDEIYKVIFRVSENNNVEDIRLYNGADDTIKHIKQSNITLIVTNIGVITMDIVGNIIYFSKPNSVSVYA